MATSAIRHVDQENSRDIKGGNSHSRAGLGPSKTFHSNNGPLATPRRALGDLGNLNFESKTKGPVKPFGKTPKLHSATPLNQRSSLSQQVDSKKRKSITSTRKNHKKVNFLKDATISKEKVGPQFPEKEMMFPFIEKDEKPPQSSYVNTILNNFGKLYHGCLTHYPSSTADETDCKLEFGFELERRPIPDVDLNILHFEGTSEGLTGDAAFSTEPEVELPPLDMDLSDLHIPTVEDIHCL